MPPPANDNLMAQFCDIRPLQSLKFGQKILVEHLHKNYQKKFSYRLLKIPNVQGRLKRFFYLNQFFSSIQMILTIKSKFSNSNIKLPFHRPSLITCSFSCHYLLSQLYP